MTQHGDERGSRSRGAGAPAPATRIRHTARRVLLALAALAAWPTLSSAQAQSVDDCWTPVAVAPNTEVELRPIDKRPPPELAFRSDSATPLESVDGHPLALPVAADTIVRIGPNAGRILVKKGPILLSTGDVSYIADGRGAAGPALAPQAGTRIRLGAALDKAALPANAEAAVPLDGQAALRATVTAPARLRPATPDRATAWLDAGALPVTRVGRMLRVDLYVPSRSAADLKADSFQACVNGRPALATVTGTRDGVATLTVLVPDQAFTGFNFWNRSDFRVLDVTAGVSGNAIPVSVGNPYISFVVGVAAATFILFLLAYWIERGSGTKPPDARILPRLFVGADGAPSLSLFQMYIWTGLVLAGMIYVFLMSGDLLSISGQVLVLLGLAGLSTIGSRFVGATAAGSLESTGQGFWGMFLVDGKPDLLRLQMFIFTVAIWIYVAVRIFYEQAFPELDTNVLLLMGISNGLYVGAKWATTGDPLATLRRLRLDLDTLQDGIAAQTDARDKAAAAMDALMVGGALPDERKADYDAADARKKAAQKALDELAAKLKPAQDAYAAELARLSK